MGAEMFGTWAMGKSAKEAFQKAREQALYEYGHRGYTGTIAEKHTFVILDVADSVDEARKLGDDMIDNGDRRIDDKWGPAGCIHVKDTEKYFFFGWASS